MRARSCSRRSRRRRDDQQRRALAAARAAVEGPEEVVEGAGQRRGQEGLRLGPPRAALLPRARRRSSSWRARAGSNPSRRSSGAGRCSSTSCSRSRSRPAGSRGTSPGRSCRGCRTCPGSRGSNSTRRSTSWSSTTTCSSRTACCRWGEAAERKYGRKNFLELHAVFSSPQYYRVVGPGGADIGSLEQDFVDNLVEDMTSFLLGGGRGWCSRSITRSAVAVRPSPRGKQPSWAGSRRRCSAGRSASGSSGCCATPRSTPT